MHVGPVIQNSSTPKATGTILVPYEPLGDDARKFDENVDEARGTDDVDEQYVEAERGNNASAERGKRDSDTETNVSDQPSRRGRAFWFAENRQ